MPGQPHPIAPDLDALIALFYDDPDELGRFAPVSSLEMPVDYRGLLAHEEHMTVTVEAFHHSKVDVRVLSRRTAGPHYSRKILLSRQTDGRVVQFGIMRVNLNYLGSEVSDEIRREGTPLGRVLIEHDVLRQVRLVGLWQVEPGSDLRAMFDLPETRITYGRTAMIDCNGEPAIELIEIVTPIS